MPGCSHLGVVFMHSSPQLQEALAPGCATMPDDSMACGSRGPAILQKPSPMGLGPTVIPELFHQCPLCASLCTVVHTV